MAGSCGAERRETWQRLRSTLTAHTEVTATASTTQFAQATCAALFAGGGGAPAGGSRICRLRESAVSVCRSASCTTSCRCRTAARPRTPVSPDLPTTGNKDTNSSPCPSPIRRPRRVRGARQAGEGLRQGLQVRASQAGLGGYPSHNPKSLNITSSHKPYNSKILRAKACSGPVCCGNVFLALPLMLLGIRLAIPRGFDTQNSRSEGLRKTKRADLWKQKLI